MEKGRKQFLSFLLIAIIEHFFVIAIVASLIYTEPADTLEKRDSIVVSLEEIKKEPDPPLKKIVIRKVQKKEPKKEQQQKLVINKKTDTQAQPPAMPKIKMEDLTSSGVALQLPTTVARVTDTGSNVILRAPGNEKREAKIQDIMPSASVQTPLKGSQKPSVITSSPVLQDKGKSEASRTSEGAAQVPTKLPSFTESSGPLSDVARPGFVGDIRGEIAGRRVVAWPKLSDEITGTQGGSATLEILVDPAGNVTKVKIMKKSGSPKLDRIAMNYVEQIRFEALPKNIQQKVQKGEVLINFELAKSN